MTYTVRIRHAELIDLLQDHFDNKIYENIKEDDIVEEVNISPITLEIIIGEEES